MVWDIMIIAGAAVLILYNLFFQQERFFKWRYLSFLSISLETLVLTLTLFRLGLRGPAANAFTPFQQVYFLLLYVASIRFDSLIILYAGIVNLLGMNSVFLYFFINRSGEPSVIPGGGNFSDQIIRTVVFLVLAILLLNRPRSIRRILKNQQDYFEKMRNRHTGIINHIDYVAAEKGLSPREKEVARELVKGKTYRMIGEELCISLDTVKSHIRNLYRKMGITSRNELFVRLEEMTLMSKKGQEEDK